MESPGEVRRETLTVAEGEDGRLDRYLAHRLRLSRTRVARLIEGGSVEVNHATAKKSDPVKAGARIDVEIPPPEPLSTEPEDIPLSIVHEDSALLVVDKPPGMVVHPAPGHPRGTLVNAILHHVKDLSGIGGKLRPGIVHRLDKETSGLMVVAKRDDVHRALSEALRRREVRRLYLAAAWGHLAESPTTVDAPLGRSPSDWKRMAVVERGRRARTHMRVRERWLAAELLDVRPRTGRTHQIRVHLAHIGHPLVGDSLYGVGWERGMGGPGRRWALDLARRAPRHFLHAARLGFVHPGSGQFVTFHAPLPPDLAEVARRAREGLRPPGR